MAMTGFSAYFNGNTVYINGAKKYVLGEILEKILDKRYRELDKLYSECKRYETILHYHEDMREANESENMFQGAINFYAKIEQMIANTPPYSSKGTHGCHERYRLLADISGVLSPAEWQGTGEIGF